MATPANPAVPAEPQSTPPAANPPAGGGAGEQFFLDVDERTKFKTREDAIKSYHEAGERISRLSPWEGFSERYGVDSPEAIEEALAELADLRSRHQLTTQELERLRTQAPQPAATSKADDPFDGWTPEARAAAANLRQYLRALGVPDTGDLKQDFESMRKDIDELKKMGGSLREQAQTSRQAAAEAHGQQIVDAILREKGLVKDGAADGNAGYFAGRAVVDWVNANQKRIDRFWEAYDSRDDGTLRGMFDEALKGFFGFTESLRTTTPASAPGNYAQRKEAAIKSAPKPLPENHGTPAPTPPDETKKGLHRGIGQIGRELYERVRAERAAKSA